MDEYRLALEDGPAPEDVERVRIGLHQYNLAHTRADDARPLTIFLRDEGGQVVGGLTGMTFWGWLAIERLWIREDARGWGYGARMVRLAEEETVARGCREVAGSSVSTSVIPSAARDLCTGHNIADGLVGERRCHSARDPSLRSR